MCSVVGCDSARRSAQRFKLPEDPERRLEWVQFLFEVNGQRLKESCWTDITICSEHFKSDCFVRAAPNGPVWLKPDAVPFVVKKEVKTEEDPPSCEVSLETQDVASRLKTDATEVPTSTPDASVQIQPRNVNNILTEKITLFRMKGKYVVNEKHLIQLLKTKCPLCGSKVKVEKVVHGMLIVLNQQCQQCDYRDQWKSLVNATVPAAEEQVPTEGTEVTIEEESEESDAMNESDESNDQGQGDVDSDEDWKPNRKLFPTRLLREECDEETEDDDEEGEDEQNDSCLGYGYTRKNNVLCTDCGKFYSKRWPHTCEHITKPYSCNICGKRCVSEVAINSHARVHNENYQHSCKFCQSTFKTKVDKINHEQIHITEGKPYKCPDCSETFASNKERRIHLVEHRGPKQLKCDICGIEFVWELSLQRHMAVHTGEKPYKCSVCDRGFNQPSHLKSHMRLHTGERPYKCQHCDKCFNHNVSLKSHVQRYHPSGGEEKREKIRSTDSEVDNREEEQDAENEAQEEQEGVPKKKKRSTGRPKGRPKSDPQLEGSDSNTKTKRGAQKSKRKQRRGAEREDEPTDSTEEEEGEGEEEGEEGEESNDALKNTSKSRGQQKHSEDDSDFDPKDQKRKRPRSQSSGVSSGKRRGRPRKNLDL